MTTRSPPLSPEQRYKGSVVAATNEGSVAAATNEGSVAAATMDPRVISSLNASMITIPKLKESENYKTWAWEVDTAFALYPEYSDALLRDGDNKSIKWTTITYLICSFEPIIASALSSKKELCRMAFKKLWKTIKREYNDTSFDTKWNLLTEFQSMKINNNYKNYFEIIKQFDECRHCLLKAGLLINELLSLFFLNIMPDTVRQFKIFNQISENDKTIPDYHYIKQKFNCFMNEELNYDCWDKMESNHLNIIMNR